MTDRAKHIGWAAETIAYFQQHCGTGNEHAIADLICDLGHLADQRGLDFLEEVRRGVHHWHAERLNNNGPAIGSDAEVKITIRPSGRGLRRVG